MQSDNILLISDYYFSTFDSYIDKAYL